MEDKNNKLLEEKIQEYKLEEKAAGKRSNRICLLVVLSMILSGVVFKLIPQTWSLPLTLFLTAIPSVTGSTVASIKGFISDERLREKEREISNLRKKNQSEILKEKTRALSLEHKKTLNEIMKDHEFSSFVSSILQTKDDDLEMYNKVKDILEEELYSCEDGVVYLDSETKERELSEDNGIVYKRGSKK